MVGVTQFEWQSCEAEVIHLISRPRVGDRGSVNNAVRLAFPIQGALALHSAVARVFHRVVFAQLPVH